MSQRPVVLFLSFTGVRYIGLEDAVSSSRCCLQQLLGVAIFPLPVLARTLAWCKARGKLHGGLCGEFHDAYLTLSVRGAVDGRMCFQQ